MSHLRDVVAALVDGELDHSERERALVHLAGCASCRAEVAAHRAVKEQLAAGPVPGPSVGFLAQLQRLAEPGEAVPVVRPTAAAAARPPTVPVRRGPGSAVTARPPVRPQRARRRIRTALGAGTAVAMATLLTAFAVGGEPVPAVHPVTPDVDTYLVEHARASRVVPFADLPAESVGIWAPVAP